MRDARVAFLIHRRILLTPLAHFSCIHLPLPLFLSLSIFLYLYLSVSLSFILFLSQFSFASRGERDSHAPLSPLKSPTKLSWVFLHRYSILEYFRRISRFQSQKICIFFLRRSFLLNVLIFLLCSFVEFLWLLFLDVARWFGFSCTSFIIDIIVFILYAALIALRYHSSGKKMQKKYTQKKNWILQWSDWENDWSKHHFSYIRNSHAFDRKSFGL